MEYIYILKDSSRQENWAGKRIHSFPCIPNHDVGCELSDFSDIFWNEGRLSGLMRKVDSVTDAKQFFPVLLYLFLHKNPSLRVLFILFSQTISHKLFKTAPRISVDIPAFPVDQAVRQQKYIHIFFHIIPHHKGFFRFFVQPIHDFPVIFRIRLAESDVFICGMPLKVQRFQPCPFHPTYSNHLRENRVCCKRSTESRLLYLSDCIRINPSLPETHICKIPRITACHSPLFCH